MAQPVFLSCTCRESFTGVWNQYSARIAGFKVSRFQGFKVSRFQGFKVSRFQGFKVTRFQGYKVSEFQGFRISRFEVLEGLGNVNGLGLVGSALMAGGNDSC
jgi:hypothetical protein